MTKKSKFKHEDRHNATAATGGLNRELQVNEKYREYPKIASTIPPERNFGA